MAMSKQKSSSINEDELASDCLETVSHTDGADLYRGAQVALESTTSAVSSTESLKHRSSTLLKSIEQVAYSVSGIKDVRGLTCVSDYVVVIDDKSDLLKLFDDTGIYITSTILRIPTFGITAVSDSMFATCGFGKTVYLWSIRKQGFLRHREILHCEDVTYHVDHDADGIHFNGKYYCLLHSDNDAITILDTKGSQVRKIIMKEACGKKFGFGFHIHMDSDTNHIYVPCSCEDGVLCLTIEGQVLWFTPLPDTPWGITEIQEHGALCVADDNCLHIITKEGEYVRKLLDQENLGGEPTYLCYGQNDRLYVYTETEEQISAYTFN